MSEQVKLAVYSIARFVKTGERAPLPPGLPPELTQRRAGVFVSLKKRGQLRGCIGTIAPLTGSVAEEILRNAVSACSEDPRFDPVTEDELDELSCSVDVLAPEEPISDIGMLDPKKYGVVVTSGYRRGLLLPDLDGVDTAEEQVAIAMRKAGIYGGEPVKLARFEVVRYK
jgi:AmmeMemoRadiSam system protein A